MNPLAATAMERPRRSPSFDILAQARRIEWHNRTRALAKSALGLGLIATSLIARGSFARAALGATGSLVLLRGVTGRALKENARALKRAFEPKSEPRFGNGKRDLVDQASWESFPASDAPGYR